MPIPRRWFFPFLILFSWSTGVQAVPASDQPVRVAVTANFLQPFRHLATLFEARSGHPVSVSSGSTGKLFAQIVHGAPYHLFLAADRRRPRLLEERGLGVSGSRFIYARGRLVLWGDAAKGLHRGTAALAGNGLKRLALANPRVAPYGRAAREVLENLGLWEKYRGRMAFGENVGQTLAFVTSGNVDAGFVALSQILDASGQRRPGGFWQVPDSLFQPLDQEAILLKTGEKRPEVRALYDFLRSATARTEIERLGYDRP